MEEEQSEGEEKQKDREEHWWTDYQVQAWKKTRAGDHALMCV
jgi:hypothetical protein